MATMAFASSSAVACSVPGARQFNTLKPTTNIRDVQSIKVRISVRAGVNPGRIGSRRKKGGGSPPKSTEEPGADDRTKEPFLQKYIRQYREEGHLSLDDAETLLAKASNPYGLVLQIAEEANEYLRTKKEESLKRKPILKVISDRINEVYGEERRDSYINEKEDYSEFEQ